MREKQTQNETMINLKPQRISETKKIDEGLDRNHLKKIKTDFLLKNPLFLATQPGQKYASSVINKDENKLSFDRGAIQVTGSELIDFSMSTNESLANFVMKCFQKCHNNLEVKYMVGLIEKELREDNQNDWNSTSLPLLPREKLSNLNIALNGDFVQLKKDHNSTTLLQKHKPVEAKTDANRLINSNIPQNQISTQPIQKEKKKSRFQDAKISEKTPKASSKEHNEVKEQYSSHASAATSQKIQGVNNDFLTANKVNLHSTIDFQIKKKVVEKPGEDLENNFKNEIKNEKQNYNKPDQMLKQQKSKKEVFSSKNVEKMPFKGSPIQLFSISELSQEKIVGTSTEFEKSYVRLTDTPNPANIRPKSVLEQSLSYVINRHKKGLEDHLYVIDQFRSIRQVY